MAGFPRSGIRELIELATATPGIVRLEVGELNFVTPAHIIEAAHRDAASGYTKYTPTAGIPSLRRAIAERAASKIGRSVEPGCVFVAGGGLAAVAAAIASIANPGERVLAPDPRWPNLMGLLALAQLVPVSYPLRPENAFLADLDDVRSKLAAGAKAIYMNNPGNPTGAVFPRDHVASLVEMAAAEGTYVIADEVYDEMVYEGSHTPAALFDRGHVITVGSFSKTYAMTGWRVGYLIAPPSVVALCEKVTEAYSLFASSISQRAAEAALTGPQECVREMRNAVRRRRDLVVSLFAGSGLVVSVPYGAFYALLDLRVLRLQSLELARLLVNEERVSTAPGSTFGETCEGMVRISLASSDEDLTTGCTRILDFVRRHRRLA